MTDNASDVTAGVKTFLNHILVYHYNKNRPEEFQVRWIAHVVNLAVTDALLPIRENIPAIRNFINAFFISVERRYTIDLNKWTLGLDDPIPILDVHKYKADRYLCDGEER